tara:strand:- start:1489 stop:3027 length:1539 start_codon:yes stop_codon:yes gene_type:complete
MAENLTSFKVFCQGGLNTSRDVLSQGETQPGSAISLINYEPAVTGGYRKISGYSNDYGTVPGFGKVLGVAVANGINDGILAARYDTGSSNYLYYWNNSTSAWVTITTPGTVDVSTYPKVRFTKYNWGSNEVMITDGVNPAAVYTGTTYTQVTHTNAPSAPKVSHVFRNHMFLAADATEPTNLWFSAPYDENDYSPANGAGVINVGFPIVAIKSFRDALYIFGSNNIRKLVGNSISDFVLQEVTDDLGCLATDSVIEIGGDLLFLSQDGLRPIGGTDKIGDVNLETVSKDIQSIFTDVVFEVDLEKLDAVVIRQKTQFRFFLGAADGQGIIGGFRQTPNGLQFEYGQLLGVFTTCATSGYIGQSEYVIHGDSAGKVHRQERGTSFDGEDIFSVFQTPFFHMQDPEQRKVFYTVATYLRSEGDNEIVLSALYDYQDVDTLSPSNFTLTTQGAAAYYNEALYDSTAIFDGNPAPVQRTNISGSGKSAALKYVTNDTNASHSIQGIVITFGVGDRL